MSKSCLSRRSRRRSLLVTLYRKFGVIVNILRRLGKPNAKPVDPSINGLDSDAPDTTSVEGSTSRCETGSVRISESRHFPELENAALPANDKLQDAIADLLQCVTEMQQSNVGMLQNLADIKTSFPNLCTDGLLDGIRQEAEGQLDSSDSQISSGCVLVCGENTNGGGSGVADEEGLVE